MMFDTPGLRLPIGVVIGTTITSSVLLGVVLTLLLRARRRTSVTGTAALIGVPGRIIHWTGLEGEILVQGERWRPARHILCSPANRCGSPDATGLTLVVEDLSHRTGAKQ